MMTRNLTSSAILLAASLLLPSCVINSVNDFDVYDSSTVNPDRFVQQTRPTWDRPPPRKSKTLPLYEGDLETAEVETVTTTDISTQVEYPAAPAKTDPFTTNTVPRQGSRYGKLDDGGHWLPAIPTEQVPAQYLRRDF